MQLHGSIFEKFSFSREVVKWEDYIYDLTPVQLLKDEELGEMWFKREDWFAPLGYGGVNGTKGRAGVFIAHEHFLQYGRVDIVHGTVVGSPQIPFYVSLSKHYGGECITVLGATSPSVCLKHPMVYMGAALGSKFSFTGSGFNCYLQAKCRKLKKERPDWLYGEYGITLEIPANSVEKVTRFALVGAEQVKNIPDEVKTLIIPFGSANSAVGILLGLAVYGHKNIERVVLIGIGPNRLRWLENRLATIGEHMGVNTKPWKRLYHNNHDIQKRFGDKFLWTGSKTPNYSFVLEHYDLYDTGWVTYNETFYEKFAGLELHPRYEAKVMRYIKQNLPQLLSHDSLFWIVGSSQEVEVMRASGEFNETPEILEVD